MTTKMPTKWTDETVEIYSPKSNAVFSGSVKGADLDDYVALRQMLKLGTLVSVSILFMHTVNLTKVMSNILILEKHEVQDDTTINAYGKNTGEIAKKDRMKPNECLLKMLLDGYKQRYKKDYLL